jgi:uncharacterized protein
LSEQLRVSVKEGRLCFPIWLQPRAGRNRILGVHGGALKVSLTAPPVEDRANRQLIEFLAEILRVPRHSICLVTGRKSRNKVVTVDDLSLADFNQLLHPYLV